MAQANAPSVPGRRAMWMSAPTSSSLASDLDGLVDRLAL